MVYVPHGGSTNHLEQGHESAINFTPMPPSWRPSCLNMVIAELWVKRSGFKPWLCHCVLGQDA